eukprot:6176573-Pleurochrysis_carterae.AAC.1
MVACRCPALRVGSKGRVVRFRSMIARPRANDSTLKTSALLEGLRLSGIWRVQDVSASSMHLVQQSGRFRLVCVSLPVAGRHAPPARVAIARRATRASEICQAPRAHEKLLERAYRKRC